MEFFSFEKQKQYKDIGVTNDDKEKKRKNSEYYDLGKEASEENEPELILFDKISALDIITLNTHNKSKNIINIQVREKAKEKDKDKDKKLLKRNSISSFDIILDFSSINDTREFINSFKKIITEFKAKKK